MPPDPDRLAKRQHAARRERPFTVTFHPFAQVAADTWIGYDTWALPCPFCSDRYLHPGTPVTQSGDDDYKAWRGRGDLVSVPFYGECGHAIAIRFGFHKGHTIPYWQEIPLPAEWNEEPPEQEQPASDEDSD